MRKARQTQTVKTVTISSRGQLTIPAALRRVLGVKGGTKIDVFPLLGREGFEAKVRRPSRILDFTGDLKHWKKPRPSQRISSPPADPKNKRD